MRLSHVASPSPSRSTLCDDHAPSKPTSSPSSALSEDRRERLFTRGSFFSFRDPRPRTPRDAYVSDPPRPRSDPPRRRRRRRASAAARAPPPPSGGESGAKVRVPVPGDVRARRHAGRATQLARSSAACVSAPRSAPIPTCATTTPPDAHRPFTSGSVPRRSTAAKTDPPPRRRFAVHHGEGERPLEPVHEVGTVDVVRLSMSSGAVRAFEEPPLFVALVARSGARHRRRPRPAPRGWSARRKTKPRGLVFGSRTSPPRRARARRRRARRRRATRRRPVSRRRRPRNAWNPPRTRLGARGTPRTSRWCPATRATPGTRRSGPRAARRASMERRRSPSSGALGSPISCGELSTRRSSMMEGCRAYSGTRASPAKPP